MLMLTSFRSATNSRFLTVLLAIAVMSKAAPDHFILTQAPALTLARIDPILTPGVVSPHMHNIMGGSCLNQNLNTPEEQQQCDCSSTVIGDDKSNYWSPGLYYQYANGSFVPMLGANRIYYFTKTKDVKPFPPGLRMISGRATYRNASDPKTLGIKISCNHGEQIKFLPNGTSHPEGCTAISLGIYLPSCGLANGQLDSDDHFSHMAWPQTQPGGGQPAFDDVNGVSCPASHPIKYPTIFLEANYYPTSEQPWHSGNPLILSTGDQSGLTFHADFVNGWNQQVLTDTIAQCGLGNGAEDQLDKCAPLAKSHNETAAFNCRFQNQIPFEDVGLYRPISKLPGCNKVWPTNGPAAKPACVEETAPSFVYPNVEFINLKYREHIPLAFTLADNVTNIRREYYPALGDNGASYFVPWGFDGSNAANLKVSTVAELRNATKGVEDNCECDPGHTRVLSYSPVLSLGI